MFQKRLDLEYGGAGHCYNGKKKRIREISNRPKGCSCPAIMLPEQIADRRKVAPIFLCQFKVHGNLTARLSLKPSLLVSD